MRTASPRCPEQIFRVFFFLAKDRQTGRGGENETCLEIERNTDREIRSERSERWWWGGFYFFFFRWMWEVNDLRSLQNLNYLLAFLQPRNCQLMATEARRLRRLNARICVGLFAVLSYAAASLSDPGRSLFPFLHGVKTHACPLDRRTNPAGAVSALTFSILPRAGPKNKQELLIKSPPGLEPMSPC